MKPIDSIDLASVRGGLGGALLGTLAQSAGPILNGVASIIGASKSGGGGGGKSEAAAATAAAVAPAGPAPSAPVSSGGGGVSVSVSFNGVQTSVQA